MDDVSFQKRIFLHREYRVYTKWRSSNRRIVTLYNHGGQERSLEQMQDSEAAVDTGLCMHCAATFSHPSSHHAFNSINRPAGALGRTTDKLEAKWRASTRSPFLSFSLSFFFMSRGVTCKYDTSHSEWFLPFLHDFRGAILTLSPPQVSSLKSKLKKQSTATGSGVARAFLRSQAALFGSYRDALRYKPVSLTSVFPSLPFEWNYRGRSSLCSAHLVRQISYDECCFPFLLSIAPVKKKRCPFKPKQH